MNAASATSSFGIYHYRSTHVFNE